MTKPLKNEKKKKKRTENNWKIKHFTSCLLQDRYFLHEQEYL